MPLLLEPKKIYRSFKEEVPEEEYTLPLGKCNVVKEGNEITVVSYGAMMKLVLEAVEKLENVSAEVIDVRTLSPLDDETIINSVKKTGRCVIVHEAPRSCGFAAEIIARINEKALLSLEAPVKRITGYDTVIPLAKLENEYLPSVKRIMHGIEEVLSF